MKMYPDPILRCLLLSLMGAFFASISSAQEDGPIGSINNGTFELALPGSTTPDNYRWIEWSTDLINWTPIARDYGNNWENTFPRALPIFTSGPDQILGDAIDAPTKFYRMGGTDTSGSQLTNANLVARFLQQTTFGPTRDLINNFPGIESVSGFNDAPYTYFEQWIDAQIAKPITSLRAYWRERSNPAYTLPEAGSLFPDSPYEVAHNPAYGHQFTYYVGSAVNKANTQDALDAGRPIDDVSFGKIETKQLVWYEAVLKGEDALRQRVAWALSQIFVVGEEGSNQTNTSERWLSFYDILIRHAFGNFRDILGEVTFHPQMGYYLTYVDNQKANLSTGIFPDENYAREVMQLFTIGLWVLNLDGTLVLDTNGDPIPTYDIQDIEEFAKVFTGLRKQSNRTNIEIRSGNYIDPMRIQVSWHDYSPKTLLDGSTLEAPTADETGAIIEINGLLDHLFNHQSTAPFFARNLIQRLTLSNPSPTYIKAVAEAFATGTYNGIGTGERGDMTAVVKAILLHPEAREPALALDAAHGKLREPLIRLLHYARAFEITSPQTYGWLPFYKLDEEIIQSPFDYPTVFNFYLPEYQPNGEILDRGVFSPEFEIHNDVTALRLPNTIHTLIYSGISESIGARSYSQGDLDLTYETALANDSSALLDHLDTMLTAGRLSTGNRAAIAMVIDAMPATTQANLEARVQRALSLFSLLPEFNILY